jgi:hypothetical protein
MERMLQLNDRLLRIGDKHTDERTRVEEEVRNTHDKLDALIHQVYGITEAEEKIIENDLN